MRLLDSRRLAGPNLHTRRAGAVAEVAFEEGEDPQRAIALWEEEVRDLAQRLELALVNPSVRRFTNGAALAFEAPLDVLMVASDVNDAAIERATKRLRNETTLDEPMLSELRTKRDEQRRPVLVALAQEAARREVPLLWDDETLSLGTGKGSRSFALDALPDAAAIEWGSFARIPVALITGTNGKSTSARLLARVVKTAGKHVGLASTDFVAVDEQVIERGDYTGPGAARLVLRREDVEVAVLETARGGILRRGLAIDRADAALITNVADDHLGEYGIDSVEQLARAKAVVGTIVKPAGRVVLNADDAQLVKLSIEAPGTFSAPLTWFALEPRNEHVQRHARMGGDTWSVIDGALASRTGEGPWTALVRVDEVPLTWGGAATYNLANALGVAALATALGLPRDAIARGLRSFKSSHEDNPGRGNLVDSQGVFVLLDFGHNAHGIAQVGKLVQALRAGRTGLPHATGALTVLAACAGDRSDRNLGDIADELIAMRPARVLVRDLPDYLRGRKPGEVPAILARLLHERGLPHEAIEQHESELASLKSALSRSQPGDLVVALVHLEDQDVQTLLAERGSRSIA
ncbi:MAG: hypothetical protein JST92_00310 [Deltaproteobacteria bacterium]|nr:hypothetical protein [Deltaproteobacteria bacterium]